MAATTWNLAPWLGNQTWLLTDNAVVQTPPVETSGSGRRIRIAGQTKSYPVNDVNDVLRDAVREVADRRGSKPWVKLGIDRDANLEYHGMAAPSYATKPNFTIPSKFHLSEADNSSRRDGQHTDIAFEFASEECPTVTAMVWVTMHIDSANDHIVHSGITYRPMHPNLAENSNYMFWSGPDGRNSDWFSPFGYYDHGDDVDAAKRLLNEIVPIQGGVNFQNHDYRKNSRGMVTDAIKLLRELLDVQTIQLPVWRDSRTPTLMSFKATGRTTFSRSLYQEMLDHVQTAATIERIQKNMQQIVKDMQTLGMVTTTGTNRAQMDFLATVQQAFGENLACHMIPVTTTGNDEEETGGHVSVEIVEDHEHTVSIDFKSGTLVVHCTRDVGVLDQWNFERTKAELTGELDAFLGFARQQQQKRAKRRVTQIVEERTPTEDDLEIPNFSA